MNRGGTVSSILVACGNKSGVERYYLPALRLGGWDGEILLVAPGDALPPLEAVSGLLLCGGMDIHPGLWDDAEAVHPTAELDSARDAFEVPLVRGAWALGLPILGICRGEQMLNVALGGSLIQDIPDYYGCEVGQHRHGSSDVPDLHHGVQIAPGLRLAGFTGVAEIRVNSRHHQAVKHLAPGLVAVAWHMETRHPGTGPLIEAVEAQDPRRWVLGVQWHPENLVGLHDDNGVAARRIFQGFVQGAAEQG